MATTMTIGGVSLGANFPLVSRSFSTVRNDDQGASFKKVTINLSGFIEGDDHSEVMALYETLRSNVGDNDTTFTYVQDSQTIYSNKKIWINAYEEPEDSEHGKSASGSYSIELYYFEESELNLSILCSYGGYVFSTTPKWSRDFAPTKDSQYSPPSINESATEASITLSGFLFADTHAGLMNKIDLIQVAFTQDRFLSYGVFGAYCITGGCKIQEATMVNYALFEVKLKYYTTQMIRLSRKIRYNRIHNNPIIKDQPYCNTRTIEFMNSSGQTITYSLSVKSTTILKAREILSEELNFLIEPGGIEMPGGDEELDYDDCSVSVSVVKFYNIGIVPNL